MLISSKNKFKLTRPLSLFINNICIENVIVQKVLGVYIDKTLSWQMQITSVCRKINIKIALLKRIIYFLTDEMKRMFYNAYIVPCFDYCCSIWGKGTHSKGDVNKILKLQKRAARIILSSPPHTDSLESFKKLQWMTFENRINYHAAVMVFKCKNNLFPDYMSNLLTFSHNDNHDLRSTERKDLVIPRHRTKYLKDTFSYHSSHVWNSLPLHIRKITKLNSFKLNVRKYLLNMQFS